MHRRAIGWAGGARPDESLVQREQHLAVTGALAELEDEYRAVIVLRDVEGFDYEQIAEILEVPAGTVKSRLHSGTSGPARAIEKTAAKD